MTTAIDNKAAAFGHQTLTIAGMSERAFAHVSKIEVLADAARTDGSTFSIGYAPGDAV